MAGLQARWMCSVRVLSARRDAVRKHAHVLLACGLH